MLVIEKKRPLTEPVRLGLLGGGVLARHVVEAVIATDLDDIEIVGMCTRSSSNDARDYAATHRFDWTGSVAGLVALRPDVVLEAASVDAASEHVPDLLEHGIDVVLLSVGALAAAGVEKRVHTALSSGAQLVIPEGAAVGLDLVRAVRGRGLERLRIDTAVPAHRPMSGVPDYTGDGEPQTIFAGSAREAVRQFPRFLNFTVAAAWAAGSLDNTEVTVTINPHVDVFAYELTVISATAHATVTVELPQAYRTRTDVNVTSASVMRALADVVDLRRESSGR